MKDFDTIFRFMVAQNVVAEPPSVPSFAVLPGVLMCVSYMGEFTV